MNDGKSIEKTEVLPLTESTTSSEASLADAQGPDLRRRRLIRGAAGIAPVVLTLRSGGLAASSCTGVSARASADNNDGLLTKTSTGGSIVVGDNCVTGYSQSGCPLPDLQILGGTKTTNLKVINDGGFYCSTTSSKSGAIKNEPSIALLSISAYNSLL